MFSIGDKVISKYFGEGVVCENIYNYPGYPIEVVFDRRQYRMSFTNEGNYQFEHNASVKNFDTKIRNCKTSIKRR